MKYDEDGRPMIYRPTQEQIEHLAARLHPIVWGEGASYALASERARERSLRDAEKLARTNAFLAILVAAQTYESDTPCNANPPKENTNVR